MSRDEYKKSGVTTIRLPQDLLDAWNAKIDRLAISRPKQVRQWVKDWVEASPEDSLPGEEEFVSDMRAFYRRATEAERRDVLMMADREHMLERQKQSAEAVLQRMTEEDLRDLADRAATASKRRVG